MAILGYVLLALSAFIVIGNLTGGGLVNARGANTRLIIGIGLAAIGAYLAFG